MINHSLDYDEYWREFVNCFTRYFRPLLPIEKGRKYSEDYLKYWFLLYNRLAYLGEKVSSKEFHSIDLSQIYQPEVTEIPKD